MAQKKGSKTTSSKNKKTNTKTSTKGRSSAAKQQVNTEVRSEIVLILFSALCILMLISCFGLGGGFGSIVSKWMFGLFGYVAYLVPIALFVGVFFYLANRENPIMILKVVAGILGVLSLEGFVHGILGNKDLVKLGAVYEYCALHHNGAGIT